MEQAIFPGMESQAGGIESGPESPTSCGALRFRRPDRSQTRLVPLSLEATIPSNHHVRVLWEVVDRLDLSGFVSGLKVREGQAGRPRRPLRWTTGR